MTTASHVLIYAFCLYAVVRIGMIAWTLYGAALGVPEYVRRVRANFSPRKAMVILYVWPAVAAIVSGIMAYYLYKVLVTAVLGRFAIP